MGEEVIETCPRHEGQRFILKCSKCGKQMCHQCRAEFGYFCSAACLESSKGTVDHQARAEQDRDFNRLGEIMAIVKKCAAAILALLLIWGAWHAWGRFVSSTGRVAWQMPRKIDVNDFHILKRSPSEVVVKSGDTIFSFNPANGREISTKTAAHLADLACLLKATPSGTVFSAKNAVALVGMDGTAKWRNEFKDPVRNAVASDKEAVVVTIPELNPADEARPNPRQLAALKPVMTAFDVETGKELWKKEFDAQSYLHGLTVGSGCCVYCVSDAGKDGKMTLVMKVADFATGKDRWQVRSDGRYLGEPEICDGMVVFKSDQSTLAAVSLADGKKQWSVPFKGGYGGKIRMKDEAVLLEGLDSLACLDRKSGKELWHIPYPVSAHEMVVADKRIFIMGYKVEEDKTSGKDADAKQPDLPLDLDKLQDRDALNKAMLSAPRHSVKRPEPMIVCLAMGTGKELWRLEKIQGEMTAGEKCLSVLMNTSTAYSLDVSNDGMGMTVLTLVNPSSGRIIQRRESVNGVIGPYIVAGRKLVGIEYERTAGGMGGGGKMNIVGLIGYNSR